MTIYLEKLKFPKTGINVVLRVHECKNKHRLLNVWEKNYSITGAAIFAVSATLIRGHWREN